MFYLGVFMKHLACLPLEKVGDVAVAFPRWEVVKPFIFGHTGAQWIRGTVLLIGHGDGDYL